MPFYVRLIKGDEWGSVSSTTGEDTSFPATVLTDVLDTQGETSVWGAGLYLDDVQTRRAALKDRELLKRAKPDEKLPGGFQHPPSDAELPRGNNRKTRIGNIVRNIRERLIRQRQQSLAAQDRVD